MHQLSGSVLSLLLCKAASASYAARLSACLCCSCVVWVALKSSAASTLLSEKSAEQIWVAREEAKSKVYSAGGSSQVMEQSPLGCCGLTHSSGFRCLHQHPFLPPSFLGECPDNPCLQNIQLPAGSAVVFTRSCWPHIDSELLRTVL